MGILLLEWLTLKLGSQDSWMVAYGLCAQSWWRFVAGEEMAAVGLVKHHHHGMQRNKKPGTLSLSSAPLMLSRHSMNLFFMQNST